MKNARSVSMAAIATAVFIVAGCAANKPCCPEHQSKSAAADSGTSKPCPAKEKTCFKDAKSFGTAFKPSDGALCVKKVLSDPASYDGKKVQVVGKVESVCAHRGCWMKLGDGEHKDTLFVKFTCPVEGRLIPMEAVGKPACVDGTLVMSEMSESEARHYQEESGASKEEIEKIVGPQKILRMKSPGARIAGL